MNERETTFYLLGLVGDSTLEEAIEALKDLQDIVGVKCLPSITITIDGDWYILNYEWRKIDWLHPKNNTKSTWLISVMTLPNSDGELVRAHLELMDSIKQGRAT